MKHYFYKKKSRWLLLAILAMMVGASPTWADELTIFESATSTHNGVPIYAYNADTSGDRSEFVVPSSMLTDMSGKNITGLTFYCANFPSWGSKIPQYVVYLKEVESETLTAYAYETDATIVYTGAFTLENGLMTVTFTTPYTYNGGHLLIGTKVSTTGSYVAKANSTFYGSTSSDVYCNKSNSTGNYFLPKTTFTYETISPYKKPASLTFDGITAEGATADWTAGSENDSEIGWDLEYKKVSADTWTEVHGIAKATTSYEFTSLESNTTYDVRVRALYAENNKSDWKSATFKTSKVASPATGFTDNFETDKGWELINGTQTNKWVRGTATNNGGDNALYISNDGGTTNKYAHTASMTFASKLFAFETGDFTIAYDWKANGESNYDFLRVALVPASVELTAGTIPSNFSASNLPTGWQALDGGSKLNLQTDWQSKSVDITIESAGAYQIVFAWKNDGSGGNQTPAAAIDNFKIIGAAPVLELGGDVAGTTLAFGSVAETTNKTITITNSGKVAMENITLTETADEDNVFAYAALPKTTLAANESMDVQATFSGSSAKDYTGTFRVSADDCDPIDITVTATYSNSPATLAVTLNEEAVGASVAFGSVGKQAQKTFTVTNGGDQTLHITSIVSNNTTDFTVAPAALEVAGHSSETFTVTFVYPNENPVLDTEKTATITVTASNEGIDAKSFTVTGTRIEQWSEDFSGGTLPDGWEITNGTYWKIQDGVAKGSYSYGNFDLYTPSLAVEEGATLSFDYRMTSTYRSLDIQYSKDNGAWTNYATISYSGLTLNQWYTYTIENLTPGNYKFRFGDSNYDLDNFQGFKRNMNDPKMGIYTDAECTVAATTEETKDFGFATTDQTASYYIKNDGTGTMTLSKGDDPAGFTATLDKTSVAAGEHATLTITMPAADNAGYHSGNIVVTATDLGDFTVAANGVVVDENKLYLDFSSDNIPSTWINSNFTKNSTDISCGYNTGTLQTVSLTATANEKVVVRAKQDYTSSSYTFGVNYRKVGDEEWSELIAPANIGTNYVTLAGTITEAGNYELQFTGKYVHISNIYGLAEAQEPVMAVYDGESLAGASYDFGNVSDEADATWTLTVKNEGKAKLTGLAAALSGTNAAHYSVEISGATGEGNDEIEANAQATITVKQLKDNIGSHEATLTISADNPIADKVIALSGYTYDHNKMFVDFEGGSFPAGWTTNSWTVATTSGNKHARAGYTASSLITTPLTVAEDESLIFKAKRQYSGTAPTFQIRYTTDGGVTWSDYADYASQVTSTDFTNITLSGINAGTAIVEIYGRSVDIDDIYGFAPTTAPVLSLTESAVAVANESTKEFGNLTEAGTATYTLSNTGTANLVSTVATTGVATAAISGEGEGVTISENTVTLAPGKSATITLTLPYGAPYGEKAGAMTISSEGWVGDMVVNYTATTIDPTALYVDFNDNTKPAGWYQEAYGWVISTGRAHVYTGVAKALVTEQYAAEEGKNVLRFDAKLQSNAAGELKIYTSTDRKTWTLAKTVTLTNEDQQVALDALADGNYYVKFESLNASIDNLTGLKRILPAPANDLYVSASNIPTATKVPETSINATATVYSLRANETGVYAKLFFDEELVATAEAQNISKDGSVNFTLTGNVPATEKTYAAKIVVYYSDNSVAFETLTTDVEVAHTRTLSITSFTRDGEGEIDANASNQFSAAFNVTVQNTGSTAATPVVKIFIGETEVGTATADAEVAVGESKEMAVNVTNASAGEGGELAFTAKAFWTAEGEAKATSASDVVITVNAAAPKFALYQDATPVNNGDDVEFGLTRIAKTYSYTIKNEGTAPMELVSIVAPTGFTATAVTNENKDIAVNGTLDIDVTLNAEQGKKSGNLVITYKVDANTNNTFTLALSGRSISKDTWVETFDTEIPASWQLGINEDKWAWDEDKKLAYSQGYEKERALTTPRLAAKKDEVLTYDLSFRYSGYTMTVQYSTDREDWTDYETLGYNDAGEHEFVAPADGNYYLRFVATRYAELDNFVGFKLNIPEHDTELASSSVPATGKQYNTYTATVTLKENAGKAEEVTAKLYVNGEVKATKNETITANGSTVVTLTWEPEAVISEAVKAYVTVTGTDIDLTTEQVDLTIAEVYTLDETSSEAITEVSEETILLKRTFAAGWNTVCLPFTIDNVEEFFGTGAKAYSFTSYTDGTLGFTATETGTIYMATPYVVYVPTAITEDMKLKGYSVTSLSTDASYVKQGDAYFRGTYAPIAAPGMEGLWGVTTEAKIAKGTDKASMKGFRAYFELPSGANAARMAFTDEDGTTTVIKAIELDKQNGEIYNLNGQRVENMKKGNLYIINGKKQIRR